MPPGAYGTTILIVLEAWDHASWPEKVTEKVTAQVGQAFFTVEPEIFLDSGISFRFKDS